MSRRTLRVAEAIREVASYAILFELKDPRVTGVTVTRAEVSGDLRHAKVFVSLMGDEKAQRLCFQGLESARGYLQRKVAERLETRYTPVIQIVVDLGVKKSLEVARLLDELRPKTSAEPEDEDTPDDADATEE